MKEIISIIVPIYNVEEYLDRCLKSLIGQTYSDIEIILVDDGSTDACPKICDRWAKKDIRIKVVHKKNGGLSDARNEGLKKASGQYILFVDSDDWIHRDMVKTLIDMRENTEADIVECKAKKVKEYMEDCLINSSDINLQEFTGKEALAALIDETPLKQTVWNKLYRRNVIENMEFEFGKVHEDEFWTYQVFARAGKIVFIDVELYYYFQRSNSIMGCDFSLERLDAIEGRYRRLEFYKNYCKEKEFEAKRNLFFLIIYYGQQALRSKRNIESSIYFKKVEEYLNKINFSTDELKRLSLSNRIWEILGRKHLKFICIIRNIAGIGTK